MRSSTGTPRGHSDPGPVEILLYPILGLLLAGLIAGLVAAVSVQLVRPWTGAGSVPRGRSTRRGADFASLSGSASSVP